MSNHTTNHSTEAVPLGETVSALRVVLVLVGVVVTLPSFMVAATIFSSLGLESGLLVLIVGGLLLSLVGSLTFKVGADTRLSTYCIIANSFGSDGAKLVNFLIALTILGWFGVTLDIFAQVTVSMVDRVLGLTVSRDLVILLGGGGMIATTVFGFAAIDRLSKVAVPLLLVALLYTAWLAVTTVPNWSGLDATLSMGIGEGISIIMGASMIMVTIAPDLSRFLSPSSSPVAASLGCYGIGYVAVLFLAGIPVLALGNKDLVANMLALGLGVPALLVVILSTWTTNVANLYSASLAAAAVFRGAMTIW